MRSRVSAEPRTKHTSISFKITCDNCPSHGVIRRIPDFNSVSFTFGINQNGITGASTPVFEWVDYGLDSIKEKNE